MGRPSIYPTGVTRFDPEKSYGGYTFFPTGYGATLMDMQGRVVKVWKGLNSVLKMHPDGTILSGREQVPGGPAGATSLAEVLITDWDGNLNWSFRNNLPYVKEDGTTAMAAMYHHEMELEQYPIYYSPKAEKAC